MSEYNFTPDDKMAMRVYLQRMEVRLSTIHRIAGLFLNGAGLLFLLPVLLRDTVKDINQMVLKEVLPLVLTWLESYQSQSYSSVMSVGEFFLYVFLFVPFLISILLPIYALYTLLKDLVQFYFSGHHASFPDGPFIPRFSLSALALPSDESMNVKLSAMRLEYTPEFARFTVPFDSKEKQYFEELYNKTHGAVAPGTRQIEALKKEGVFNDIHSQPLDADIISLNTAFGLAGLVDAPLVAQVAKMELSLTRHILHLRRIVLRYVKALILFVCTTFISFIMASIITNSDLPSLFRVLTLSTGYVIWAIIIWFFVKKPIRWIWLMSDRNTGIEDVKVDLQITKFEKDVLFWAKISASIATLVIIIALIMVVVP